MQNDAVAAAFEEGKARAEKLSKDAAKTKKARETKKSRPQRDEKVKIKMISIYLKTLTKRV